MRSCGKSFGSLKLVVEKKNYKKGYGKKYREEVKSTFHPACERNL
jgi:hypothetical protein